MSEHCFDPKCLELAEYFYPHATREWLENLAQQFQDAVESAEDIDDKTLPIPDFLRDQENLRAERTSQEAATLCDDCPPVGYPTDKTRCAECPRMETCEQCSGAKRTSDGLNCTACNAMGESTEKTKVQATILPCGCDIAKTAKWIRRECGCLPRERDLRGDPTDI